MPHPNSLSVGDTPGGKFSWKPTQIGTTVGIGERIGDPHLACHRWIFALELHCLDDLCVGHKLDESAVERVGLWACLASRRWRVICQGDPERAALGGIERVDSAGHLIGKHPLLDSLRVEQRSVNPVPRGPNVPSQAGRAH